MRKNGKKRTKKQVKRTAFRLFMLAAVFLILITGTLTVMSGIHPKDLLEKIATRVVEPEIPENYIPLYQEAADAYEIPWTLLAAHHRVETRFSKMDPLLSPVGAEGHMQFMPCTFVGWEHPTCGELGQGKIDESDKTDPAIILKYGGYGIDGDRDGLADPYNLTDALYSAANYLAQNGAATGELKRAILEYNQSEEYVEDVLFYYNKYEEQYRSQ